MFSCEFCETFKKTFFIEHLRWLLPIWKWYHDKWFHLDTDQEPEKFWLFHLEIQLYSQVLICFVGSTTSNNFFFQYFFFGNFRIKNNWVVNIILVVSTERSNFISASFSGASTWRVLLKMVFLSIVSTTIYCHLFSWLIYK